MTGRSTCIYILSKTIPRFLFSFFFHSFFPHMSPCYFLLRMEKAGMKGPVESLSLMGFPLRDSSKRRRQLSHKMQFLRKHWQAISTSIDPPHLSFASFLRKDKRQRFSLSALANLSGREEAAIHSADSDVGGQSYFNISFHYGGPLLA